jgi:hypothetical protein
MKRYYYKSDIRNFLSETRESIIGKLSIESQHDIESSQMLAWKNQIEILQNQLSGFNGTIFFEYSIPRMGKRIDTLVIIDHAIFVLEFKVGESVFLKSAINQVWDYSIDLKNFHETSHKALLIPVLIATNAQSNYFGIQETHHNDNLILPICISPSQLHIVINEVLEYKEGNKIEVEEWVKGRYSPTPTIIEAAITLYREHSVKDIIRKEAENLDLTTNTISKIIAEAESYQQKAICFVTGVPGAGKTLCGLDIAINNLNKSTDQKSVYLSGNGPLVAILREALTRDMVSREKLKGTKIKKGSVMSEVKSFIQNVHHYRDEYLRDEKAPVDHVAIFDEAQRAWNLEQTVNFMRRKKNQPNFHMSEPEFLISCLDRHQDWAVIVCLVGGGQEINTGEAGIVEWINAINRSFPNWNIYISDKLKDAEYAVDEAFEEIKDKSKLHIDSCLHLSVSLRSFRAENLSFFIKSLLDLDFETAKRIYNEIQSKYPIVLTRDLTKAKNWLRNQARGSERYGLVVSSQAQRLKPYAIDVKSPMDPIHWFLDERDDVRSSYYLEDVATEFHVQGLELDWTCVVWDADFRLVNNKWQHYSFVGSKWQNINKKERQHYLKNAYRVLLTRARQGMVIVVPIGDDEDHTRNHNYFDGIYEYLKKLGLKILEE